MNSDSPDVNGQPTGRLSKQDIETLGAALAKRPEIAFAYLFGSASAEGRHRRRDVDVAVFLDPDTSCTDGDPLTNMDVWTELHDVARRALPGEEIDLILLHRASPLLADRVCRGRVLFSRDEVLRIRWTVATKGRYCDLRPLRTMLNQSLERRTRAGRFGHRSASG